MRVLVKGLIGLFCIGFMVSAYSVGTAAAPSEESFEAYIEVCDGNDAYIPPGTKFVTCHGKVMRVLGFVRMPEGEKGAPGGDCRCPQCCGGICVIVVSCGDEAAASGMADKGDLCFVYLACGD